MKQTIAVLSLLALLLGSLAACRPVSDIEAFHTFMEDLTDLTEYRFSGDITVDFDDLPWDVETSFLFRDLLPMRFTVAGTVSHRNREMAVNYVYRAADGTSLFAMDVILREETMYLGLLPMLDHMLRPILEDMGLDMDDLDMSHILGDYTYLAVPYTDALTDMMFAPTGIDTNIDVSPFLTRDGDRFTITLLGEDVRILVDDLGNMFNQFANLGGSGETVGDLLSTVGTMPPDIDLTDARILIVTARTDDALHQTVEMDLPGSLRTRANFSFIPEYIWPVDSPSHTLTETEFAARLANLDFGERFLVGTGEEIMIVYNLQNLRLTDYTPAEESRLTTAELDVDADRTLSLPVIYGAPRTQAEFQLLIDADAIGMHYTFLPHSDAVDAVLLAVAADQAQYFLADSALMFSVLRSNTDYSIAAMGIAEETAAGMRRVCIYLAQTVPGGAIRLELVFYLDLFTEEDHAILAELSQAVGLDLSVYLTELFHAASGVGR